MLSDYILHKIVTLYEKTYNRLVIALASTAMASVLTSGVALLTIPNLKYLSIAPLAVGLAAAEKIMRSTEIKVRKLLEAPEREVEVANYLTRLKDLYIERDYLTRYSQQPKIEDPLLKKEKKPLEASRRFLKSRYTVLKTRNKLVVTATALAVALPHLIIEKDVFIAMAALALALYVKKL